MSDRDNARETGRRRRRWLLALLVLCGLLGASLGALALQREPRGPADTLGPEAAESSAPRTETLLPEPSPTPAEPPVQPLDFSSPAPEGEAVPEDWFEDAVFVGDSRSDGLRLYSGIRGADFLAYKSLMSYQITGTGGVEQKAIPRNGTGEKRTVLEWLEDKNYGKVYIMLGINEMGFGGPEGFQTAMGEIVDQVRARQPEAVIYIQSLVPIRPELAREMNPAGWLNNDNVAAYDQALRAVCEEKKAVYVDVAAALVGEDGSLPLEGTTDGVHFTRSWYEKWYESLRTHTVDPEAYWAGQEAQEEQTD